MLSLPFKRQLFHFVNFSFKGVSQVEDNLSADDKEVAFLVSFGSTVALKVMAFLENVSITEVTSFNISNKGHEVRVGRLLISIMLISVFSQ
jgi:hypothetical protein